MKPAALAFPLLIFATTLATSLPAEELTLKPLEPIVSELVKSADPDFNELGYVSARGAALFLALAAYIEANPRADGTDKPILNNFNEKGMAHFRVAVIIGLKFSKTEEATVEQMKLLLETYGKMIVKSKQLNNEIFSPAIRKDLETLKSVESVVLHLDSELAKKARSAPSK